MSLDQTPAGIGRRTFLRGTGAAVALTALMTATANAQPGRPGAGGYGELVPAPGGDLLLPTGFTYVAFGQTGSPMSDNVPTPGRHDGMAAFDAGNGMVRLVRNHEQGAGDPFVTPAYDSAAAGGTTNLLFDTNRMELVSSFGTLSGTIRNCAGGPTPWGSWLTCEETYPTLTVPHGYIFEVPADATGPVDPVPLTAMGRFYHEAVCVDPGTGIVYETEDRGTSGFYRFIPTNPGNLAAGGALEMLAVKGRPNYDTRTGQRPNANLPVEWVPIADPDPDSAEVLAVYNQGFSLGGATFGRLEGAWWSEADDSAYFVSTSGGNLGAGQIWQYTPRGNSGGQLKLVYESTDRNLLESPDNITVSPRTGGLVLCEDGDGKDFVRGLTTRGEIFPFCEFNGLNNSEWAGATFSPDGRVLFVNQQSPGTSYAITGPWEAGAL